jgi:hypothetical protein
MTADRTVAEARLKSLYAEVLRGLSLVALRRAEDVREEMRATRAEINQRRLHDARRRRGVSQRPRRFGAQR